MDTHNYSAYQKGCRCDVCRAANNARQKDWARRNPDKVAAQKAKQWRNLTPEQREARRQYLNQYLAEHPEQRAKNLDRKRVARQDPEYRRHENKTRTPESLARASRKWLLKSKYGITPAQYDEMLAAQGGVCAICQQPPPDAGPGSKSLAVDHNHETGANRGILCHSCNLALGALQDGALFEAARRYLDRYR